MDAEETARTFAELYAAIYRYTYRRRDPREPRASGEALAMLQHLRDSGPLSIAEAARHFSLSQSSISERIRRLTDRGFVESIPDERDRRRHLVWLTEAGEELLRVEFRVLSPEFLEGATRRMRAADRASLIKGMDALLGAARAHARETKKE
jgi:DNA-binding MarR family transcriptional regulator